jgi:hypothetical protein
VAQVEHWVFDWTVDVLLFVYAVLLVVHERDVLAGTSADVNGMHGAATTLTFELCFTVVFVCEMAAKLAALGWYEYTRRPSNCFDGLVTVLTMVASSYPAVDHKWHTWNKYIFTLRLARFGRLLGHLPPVRHVASTVWYMLHAFKLVQLLLIMQVRDRGALTRVPAHRAPRTAHRAPRTAHRAPRTAHRAPRTHLTPPTRGPYGGPPFVRWQLLFSAVGMQAFGGLINYGPQRAALEKSTFGSSNERAQSPNHASVGLCTISSADRALLCAPPSQYYANNFNDLASGMVVCFELLVVNNWFILADGFCQVAHVAGVRAFFLSVYIIGVLVCLNVVTSFAIDSCAAPHHTH